MTDCVFCVFKSFSRFLSLVREVLDAGSMPTYFAVQEIELGQTDVVVGSQKMK